MASIEISDESLELAKLEAVEAGLEPEKLIEQAIRQHRLRKELAKGHDSITQGRVKPLDMDAIMEKAKQRIDDRSNSV